MKKAVMLALLALLLGGCAAARTQTPPPVAEERLHLYSCLPEEVCDDLVREFEQRTGIWVEVRTGAPCEMAEASSDGVCDLLLGCEVPTLAAQSHSFQRMDAWSTDEKWLPVARRSVVLIYNSKLIRQNPPEGLQSLLAPDWRGQIAFADPEQSDFGGTVLEILRLEMGQPEGWMPRLVDNLGAVMADPQAVIDSVADGSYPLAVAPEDAVRRRIAQGVALTVVYPQEGDYWAELGCAIPETAAHPENAEAFVDFLLGKDAQNHCAQVYGVDSVENMDNAGKSLDPETAAANRQGLLEAWRLEWERRS